MKFQSAKVWVAVNIENESGNVFLLQKRKRENSAIDRISPSKSIKFLDNADAQKEIQDILGLELENSR